VSKPLDYHALRARGFRVVKASPTDPLWHVTGYGINTMMTDHEAAQLLGSKGDALIRRAEHPDVANAADDLRGKGYAVAESPGGNVLRVTDNAGHERRIRVEDIGAAAATLPALLNEEADVAVS
jgi:hypothetical protein